MSSRPNVQGSVLGQGDRRMTPTYVAVIIVEALVLGILWWATRHFSS
jgi:hypothetical protein